MESWQMRLCALVVVFALSACGGPITSEQPNHALAAGEAFSYQIQPLVESDAAVVYQAALADGRSLPGWLRFDPQALRFSGVAPEGLPGSIAESLMVQVVASDASGALAKSTHSVRVMAATTTVPQIVNPAEELQAFSPTGILRWSTVTGADAFEVWAYKDSALTQLQEFSKALVSRQYQFTQLAADRTYYIKLYYRVSGSWRELPAFSIRTTLNVDTARLTNSQEELDALSTGATLRWTTVQGADVYELWVYRDANLQAFAEASGPVRITQYQITSLKPGATYYVQVYSRVNGIYSVGGPLKVTVTAETSKARILNPQEELDAFATNGILRWSPVTGATAYELWIFTNPNSSEIFESSGSLTARSYTTKTLQPGTVYYAQAYALVNGQWQVGAPVKITTTGQVRKARLTTPQEELETFGTTGTLRWTEVPGATAYELWIYGNAGLGTIVESGASTDRSYQAKKLCSNAVYYVQVYAFVDGQWTTGWATQLNVTTGQSPADCVPPAPQVSLTASADDVAAGSSVTLTWTTKFATSCVASDSWSGAKALSGQETVGPITKKSLFTLTCSGQSGTYPAQTLVGIFGSPDAPIYQVTDLGTLGGSKTFGVAINNSGQVVGYSTNAAGANRAFLWSGGVLSDLGTLGGSSGQAFGINNLGQIVGTSALPGDSASRATLWTNGTVTDLGTLMPPPNNVGWNSRANGINDAGQVVGVSDACSPIRCDIRQHAFIYAGGVMTDLGTSSQEGLTGWHSATIAINNTGRIAGHVFFEIGMPTVVLWDSTRSAFVSLFGTGPQSSGGVGLPGVGINGAGQVVASAYGAVGTTGYHAVMWDKGAIADLGALYNSCESGPPCRSGATAINDTSQVVGFIGRAAGGSPVAPDYVDNHAALWTNGKVFDLNTLLDPDSPISPYVLRYATALNDSGLIVAVGYEVDATNPFKDTGVAHTFLLSPVQ